MIVTKNIFGKIKKVEISVTEIQSLIEMQYFGESFLNWLTDTINIEWIEPEEQKKEEFKV